MIGTISNLVGNVIDTVKSPFVGSVGVKSVSKRVDSRKMSMKRTSGSRQSRTKVLAKSKKRK